MADSALGVSHSNFKWPGRQFQIITAACFRYPDLDGWQILSTLQSSKCYLEVGGPVLSTSGDVDVSSIRPTES